MWTLAKLPWRYGNTFFRFKIGVLSQCLLRLGIKMVNPLEYVVVPTSIRIVAPDIDDVSKRVLVSSFCFMENITKTRKRWVTPISVC
jgi:hypothetical protein